MKKSLSIAWCCLIATSLVAALVGIALVPAVVVAQEATVAVNIGINYGTGSIEWHNNTMIPSGENLLNVTMRVATVEFTNFPGIGAFVTSINGRSQNPSTNTYWMYWVYNMHTRQYELGPVGAGSYLLTSDQTVQWCLSSSSLGPNPSVSLSARLDTSTDPPTAVISGSIHPTPMSPVNVTLEYSQDQGADYREIARVTSAADGTFSYSWKLPSGGMFLIRADAQGVKSSPASLGTRGGIPGFPLESLLVGSTLGLLFLILRDRKKTLFGN
jgi:hypothetical protein